MSGIAYIAGPVSGKPNGNRHAFTVAASKLKRLGWTPVNPRTNPNSDECAQEALRLGDNFASGQLYRAAMRECFTQVLLSDAVFLLEGWRQSNGACREVVIAQACGTSVYILETNMKLMAQVIPIVLDPPVGS